MSSESDKQTRMVTNASGF